MARERLHTTLHRDIMGLARAVMRVRGFDKMADFLSQLFREEWERRFTQVQTQLPLPTQPLPPAHPPLLLADKIPDEPTEIPPVPPGRHFPSPPKKKKHGKKPNKKP